MIRRPPRSTHCISSAASDVYKRQYKRRVHGEEANRLNNGFIGPEHLFLGLLRNGEGKAIEILSKLNINFTEIKTIIENKLREMADPIGCLLYTSPSPRDQA
eukprot:TRINITY_DN10760_c0_g1_i1.p3 TRINITY_DN10760_c0_g1~~TRINITY_DN10760_c0_g1_i1.p3  ORF type:complete len:102 (-),score=28.67 TRINITY_DN10760_c0_g1_i1:114-419(-)